MRFVVAFVVTSLVAMHARAEESSIVRVKKDSVLTRYRLISREGGTVAAACPRTTLACRHRLVPGTYKLEVLPDRDAPGYRTSFTTTGDTAIKIRHGSKTERYVGITMIVAGGVAAVGGFLASAVFISPLQRSGPNEAATAWGIVAGSGLVVTLSGILTFVSGGTTVSIVHKF